MGRRSERKINKKSNGKLTFKERFKKVFNKKWKVALLVIFSLLIIVGAGALIYAQLLLGSMQKVEISTTNEDLGIVEDDSAYYNKVNGITNVVFYGIDSFDGKSGRSDAIMIVTIDENTKKLKLTSIPRDTYVNIPDRGMDKINHAYAFGGPQLALKTLNSNFGLDVKYFATVNFSSLPKIIDAVGGVTITVSDSEASTGKIPGITKAGTYKMNGEQALWFSRIRKNDSDFERGRRQRDVIEAIINKMFTQSLSSYPNTMKKILPLVTTNMSSVEILAIATDVVTKNISTIEQSRYPLANMGKGQSINGVYYYVFDIEATKELIGKYLYLDQK